MAARIAPTADLYLLFGTSPTASHSELYSTLIKLAPGAAKLSGEDRRDVLWQTARVLCNPWARECFDAKEDPGTRELTLQHFFDSPKVPPTGKERRLDALDMSSLAGTKAVLTHPPHLMAKYNIDIVRDSEYQSQMDALLKSQSVQAKFVLRSIGAMMGFVCGDALATPLHRKPIDPSQPVSIFRMRPCPGMALVEGQWLYPTCIALSTMDSLISCGRLDIADLHMRYWNSWNFGYNRSQKEGKIYAPLDNDHFRLCQKLSENEAVKSVGCAPLYATGPIAMMYHKNLEEALQAAEDQCLAVDSDPELVDLCRFLVQLTMRAMRLKTRSAGDLLVKCGNWFEFKSEAVGKMITAEPDDDPHQSWHWKKPSYRMDKVALAPGSRDFGSKPIEVVAMALHCLWNTGEYKDACIMAANIGGENNPTAAIAGQIGGALYGMKEISVDWAKPVGQWSGTMTIFKRSCALLYPPGATPDPDPVPDPNEEDEEKVEEEVPTPISGPLTAPNVTVITGSAPSAE